MENHLISQTKSEYYSHGQTGNYQFTSLETLINHFMAVYVGEDKLINRVSRSDVQFHAQRAMQELSFDTFKSVKGFEFTVPNNLTVRMPIDYVNYTKLSWVDSVGIEHTIYPTSKTSNPTYKEPLIDYADSQFIGSADSWTLGTGFSWTDQNNTYGSIIGGSASYTAVTSTVAFGTQIKIPVPKVKTGREYRLTFKINSINAADSNQWTQQNQGHLKAVLYGEQGFKSTFGKAVNIDFQPIASGLGEYTALFYMYPQHNSYETTTDTDEKTLMLEVVDEDGDEFLGIIDSIVLTEVENDGSNEYQGTDDSQTWQNYKSSTPTEVNDDYEDDVYWPLRGGRHGLEPEHAQANGSFYIDQTTGMLHFSSNLSGKLVVLRYISDTLGTTHELQVHKFAEEAMYKWIIYGILSVKWGVPEYIISRFKKEKRAETRKAKLRLSNIKLEEITQILRGKSKWIKH